MEWVLFFLSESVSSESKEVQDTDEIIYAS